MGKAKLGLFLFLMALCGLLLLNWREIGQRYYPLKYREIIFRHAQANGIDPLLVAAIIKTESNFHPEAVSPRGAIGLMQLLPSTAQDMARLRDEPFDPRKLYDPETNIALGTSYLAVLFQEFHDPVLVLAAYNGGRGNVERWLKSATWSGKELDLDQIPFPETRQFVRKTLWNYRVYRFLYREESSRTTAAHRGQSSG
ncbi:lytic transglycosylase domain-containing protein [Ammonifex thiophilus]|uniref:Lytic transglycosylase domain-containing protein n=1 Tax=Ammonifex thiophilus TaxID=444093 RepID=A0A3D8P537_9THEO|nr:lytic transglycosylase domain-containing protein [Ammonifex thiophilus]RDV83557.1 lytic transglycosylase domain-containing protein [Ammonifex thiophilus]